MKSPASLGVLNTDAAWSSLNSTLDITDESGLLSSLCGTFREAGAVSFIYERSYIDRDFSAVYSAFYSTLFRPYLKYCSRLHFFDSDVSGLGEAATAEEVTRALERRSDSYLGFIIIRPVPHAPIGTAVLAAERLTSDPSVIIDTVAHYHVHLLGADLKVVGFPLAQQDTRVGACAQAAIWMAGRHFYAGHNGPWFSMPQINEAALNPTDILTTRSLPAGSEFLTPDNIVRALRALERHPVVQFARVDADTKNLIWTKPPQNVIARYLDSGIPVLIGLRGRDGGLGHAVVAVGRVIAEQMSSKDTDRPSTADLVTHFLVNDDQRGTHKRLPVSEINRSGAYPWTLEEDALWVMVPLPSKVFMTGDIAEELSRDLIEGFVENADKYRERAQDRAPEGSPKLGAILPVDASFYGVAADQLVSRTYLTFGWKYKRRALRNRLPDPFKAELLRMNFPRYVWVTEFSLRDDLKGYDPCKRKVRAHIVLDATGSRFAADSNLIAQIPGLSLFWTFDVTEPLVSRGLVWRATNEAEPFHPKVRGWQDYDVCDVSEKAGKPPPELGQ
jgi:hypothetical protein